jgi:hypothetical protein
VVPVTCPSCHECKGGACVEKIAALCDPAQCQIMVCDIGQNDWACVSKCPTGHTCYDVTQSNGTKTGVCKEKCPDDSRICRQPDGTPYCCTKEWNCCGGTNCLPPDQTCP